MESQFLAEITLGFWIALNFPCNCRQLGCSTIYPYSWMARGWTLSPNPESNWVGFHLKKASISCLGGLMGCGTRWNQRFSIFMAPALFTIGGFLLFWCPTGPSRIMMFYRFHLLQINVLLNVRLYCVLRQDQKWYSDLSPPIQYRLYCVIKCRINDAE